MLAAGPSFAVFLEIRPRSSRNRSVKVYSEKEHSEHKMVMQIFVAVYDRPWNHKINWLRLPASIVEKSPVDRHAKDFTRPALEPPRESFLSPLSHSIQPALA